MVERQNDGLKIHRFLAFLFAEIRKYLAFSMIMINFLLEQMNRNSSYCIQILNYLMCHDLPLMYNWTLQKAPRAH